MARDKYYQAFPPGYYIFQEGEPGDTAYIIEKGSVEINSRIGDKELCIAELGPGDLFGEMALVGNQRRSPDTDGSQRHHHQQKVCRGEI